MVLPQGPPTGPSHPIPARQAPRRQGWHCFGYNDRLLRAFSETRPLLGSCLAPFLVIILLNQFSKTVPTHDNVPTMASLQLESR